jgi:hypothetical protein
MMNKKSIFLIVQYFKKPRPGVNTSQKGWMDNPDNVMYDEKVEVGRVVKPKDMNAQLIIDLKEKTVVTNKFNDNRNFDEIFEYYFVNYHKYIMPVMVTLDPEYIETLAKKLEKIQDEQPEIMPGSQLPSGTISTASIQEAVINAETQAQ